MSMRHEKFWLNKQFYICIDVLRSNKRVFEYALEQYKGDLVLANSLRYTIELIDELDASYKKKDLIAAVAAHKRYADHWNNTLRKQVTARNIRL